MRLLSTSRFSQAWKVSGPWLDELASWSSRLGFIWAGDSPGRMSGKIIDSGRWASFQLLPVNLMKDSQPWPLFLGWQPQSLSCLAAERPISIRPSSPVSYAPTRNPRLHHLSHRIIKTTLPIASGGICSDKCFAAQIPLFYSTCLLSLTVSLFPLPNRDVPIFTAGR